MLGSVRPSASAGGLTIPRRGRRSVLSACVPRNQRRQWRSGVAAKLAHRVRITAQRLPASGQLSARGALATPTAQAAASSRTNTARENETASYLVDQRARALPVGKKKGKATAHEYAGAAVASEKGKSSKNARQSPKSGEGGAKKIEPKNLARNRCSRR